MNITTHHKPRPSFLEGVVVALVASVGVSVSAYMFDWLLPSGLLVQVLVSVTGLGYLLYLFSRCREKVGRITALSIYVISVIVMWVAAPALPWIVIAHLGLVWLTRSLYFYSSVISALLDLGLTALSLIAAVAAYLHSGSLFLGLWSLFLIQALFTWIPVDWQRRPSKGEPAVSKDRFQTAYQAADNAVRQLATH